ncbi:hypothetical protein, partial [Streptomyces sp. NRRL S-378]|uniref:hypothetical protein n=1 Tax=Streptomyces sp. NRRL S-378 TaxID=1463904 RepID=UPI00055B6624
QRELLGTEDDPDSLATRQLAHWKHTLDGIPDQLQLPYDHPRPTITDHHGDTVPLTIDPTLHHHLTTL